MQIFANQFHFDEHHLPVDIQDPAWPECPYEWAGQKGCSMLPRTNFDTFLGAFTATFETIIEGWSANVNDARRSVGDAGALFFVGAVVIGHLILLNLFLAILLVEFEREKDMETQKKANDLKFGIASTDSKDGSSGTQPPTDKASSSRTANRRLLRSKSWADARDKHSSAGLSAKSITNSSRQLSKLIATADLEDEKEKAHAEEEVRPLTFSCSVCSVRSIFLHLHHPPSALLC